MKIIVPEIILRQVASKCKPKGSRDFFAPVDLVEPLEYFIQNKLELLDHKLYNKYKYLTGISERTLRHAWNQDGIPSAGATKDLINLLCYFGFGKNWNSLKSDLGLTEYIQEYSFSHNGDSTSSQNQINEIFYETSIPFFTNKILIELTTRKAALNINFNEDSIEIIYDSYYELFRTIRNELKSVSPIQNTSIPVKYAYEILNTVLRPHLTKHQSNFRRWCKLNREIDHFKSMPMQEFQQHYPDFITLKESLLKTNKLLQDYAIKFRKLLSDSLETL